MNKNKFIKTLNFINPFNNMEKLLLIAREDNRDCDRFVLYLSKVMGKKISKPTRVSLTKLKEELRYFSDSQKEELKQYLRI